MSGVYEDVCEQVGLVDNIRGCKWISINSQIAEDLPFEIKVFSDFQAAEDWIINK